MIGIHTVNTLVKAPNLLKASNLRELVGGGLCSKGAERSGKVTAIIVNIFPIAKSHMKNIDSLVEYKNSTTKLCYRHIIKRALWLI